jgi:hypothetical protein
MGPRWLGVGAAVAAMLSLAGCFSVVSSSIENRSADGVVIHGYAHDTTILHLTKPLHLTQTADSALLSQCPSNHMTNVQTELQVRDFFVVQMYTIEATAICL